MTKKALFDLSGGINNQTRPDLLEDNQLQAAQNYECRGRNGTLYKRTDPATYLVNLNYALSRHFDTVISISPAFYPSVKPDDMTDDHMLLVFGKKDDSYYLYLYYEQSGGYKITIPGVTYSADSVLRFAIAHDRVIITDYEGGNVAHYFTIDEDGNRVSGIMGINAPLNKPGISQMTDWDATLFEENNENDYLSECGLVQVCYTVATKDGEESNPSPVSNTLDMQFFKLEDGEDARFLEKIQVSNLSIPPRLASNIKDKLKYFNIYVRVFRYSAGSVSKSFEYSQRFAIIDKDNASGSTGNNYSITVSPTAGQQVSHENDVAPIAKYPAALGGVTMLACCKTKIKFPAEFDRYVEIKLNNQDSKTYIDAVIRIQLKDETYPSDFISDLDWTDFDPDDNYVIGQTGLNQLRVYDNDLTTPLSVVYDLKRLWNGGDVRRYCDIYIKIPQLEAGNVHSLYFCFGGIGVDVLDLKSADYGQWVRADAWTGQQVFQPLRVWNTDVLICSPVDMKRNNNHVLNKVNDDDTAFDTYSESSPPPFAPDYNYRWELIEASWESTEIAKVSLFQKLIGNSCFSLDNANGKAAIGACGLTEMPDKGFISFYFKHSTISSETRVFTFYDNTKSERRCLGIRDVGAGEYYWFVTDDDHYEDFTSIFKPNFRNKQYFVLFSWDEDNISLFIVDLDDNTYDYQAKTSSSVDMSDMNLEAMFAGAVYDTYAHNGAEYDQIMFVKDVYFNASNADHRNTVYNIANFMPPLDTMIGYKPSDSSSNNNIEFGDTEAIEYKTHENMIKWTEVNGLAFPDLNYKKVKEPVNGFIPAPSFLRYQYQNTVLIYTRNSITRFILSGVPSSWRGSANAIIEEKTQYGLSSPRSLVKIGDALFWHSEIGVIRWDPNGLRPISRNVIDVPLLSSGEYLAFYCPLRNQYIITDNANSIAYAYVIDQNKWFYFTEFNVESVAVLSGGLDADNVNLFLHSNEINKYPTDVYTEALSFIQTKDVFFEKGVLRRMKVNFEKGVPDVLIKSIVTKNNVDGLEIEKTNTITNPNPRQWRGIAPANSRGKKVSFRIENPNIIRNIMYDLH